MLSSLQATFGALSNRHFRFLWVGSLCAYMGFFTSILVQAVVAFELTGRNSSVGAVVFARGLSMIMLGPVGGAMADRVSKRAILLLCQSVTTIVFAWLAFLMARGAMTLGYLVAGGFLIGLTFAFLGPTRAAYSIELVEPPRRGNAMALNQVALNASRVVGPALGGLLLAIELVGATGAFLAMALLYALAVLLQRQLPRAPPREHAPPKGLFADVWDGLTYVRGQPRLRTLVAMFMLIVMLGMPHVTVLPGLCENQLGLPTATVSLLFSVSAAGGLLASLLMAPLADTPRAMPLYVASGMAFGLSLCALWMVEQLWTAAVVMFAVGVSTGGLTTMNGPVVMRQTDSRYMGRVMSLTMLSFGASGLLGLPVGALADAFGEGATLALCGVAVCLVVALLAFALRRHPEPAAPAA